MRLIDADALIESKFKNDISYNAFVNLVKRQPTVEITLKHIEEYCRARELYVITAELFHYMQRGLARWIPVTERLPETEDHVLAVTETKAGKQNIVRAYYSHELRTWAAGMNSNVTHWMPLPEPPEKGE